MRKDEMTPERAARFLRDMAAHFENQALRTKGDAVYWAHIGNAETCGKIAKMLEGS